MLKRKIVSLLCVIVLFVMNSISVTAMAGDLNDEGAAVTSTITITDPETGHVWESEIPSKDLKIRRTPGNYVFDGSFEETVMVSVDIGEYIRETLPRTRATADQTITDGMTIKTGMTYNYSGQNVRITAVSGATTPKGLYYAENRKQYYRHPGTSAGGSWTPTTNSWKYIVDSGYGLYVSSAPPKAILDCTIRVAGMSAFRKVSVTCSL